MKIVFTGGGSGGHFYPIIAIAEKINKIAEEEHLLSPRLYFISPEPYDKKLLSENGIEFRRASAGKLRRYFSVFNILDIFKTIAGIFGALIQLYRIFPDVVFSKGGYASFPTLLAAHILGIPVVIHESDSVPGKTNIWAGKFAKKVALSYANAAQYFQEDKIALTGNPIRQQILLPQKNGAYEFLKLDDSIPVVLVLGGSLGAQKINDTILSALPQLVEKYQIIHQTGRNNITDVKQTASIILDKNPNADRYHPYAYLDTLAMKMSAGIAKLIISRGGSTIFEIAAWGVPSIIIPIENTNGDHQRKNATAYAKTGAALVIEEKNLAPNVLIADIDRLMENIDERKHMEEGAHKFAMTGAADKIAKEILRIGLEHEK